MNQYIYTQGIFTGKGNIELSYQGWSSDRPKALVVLVHGLGEHSGRYMNIIDSLEGKGVSFFGFDLRGHGRSKGIRGHVDSFMDYIIDLKIFVNKVREEHAGLPVIMLGHSLGGAIAFRYALTYQHDLDALVLCSPALISAIKVPQIKTASAQILSSLFPTLNLFNSIDPSFISHDEEAVKSYNEDPLVHNLITPRFYTEFTANGEFCLEHANQLRLPLMLIHGTDDQLCDIKGTERTFEESESAEKNFVSFPGLYHELMNETEKERTKVLTLLSKWIPAHINKTKSSSKRTNIKDQAKSSLKAAPKKIPAEKTVAAKK
ncbi:MAG: lysophospholipase [Spirochaetota bacterium]